MSKEHSLAGQAEARSEAPQASRLRETARGRLRTGARRNSIRVWYGIYIDSVNQPQSGEERFAKPFRSDVR